MDERQRTIAKENGKKYRHLLYYLMTAYVRQGTGIDPFTAETRVRFP